MSQKVLTKHKALTEKELELINSKPGLKALFRNKKLNLKKVLIEAHYEHELKAMQTELIKLQTWVINEGKKIVILFEGRDAAGKGGAIRRITQHINPRHFKVVALDIPTEDERNQWFFQRYINRLPKPGEMVFFDRSWYNRAVVEPVNNFCSEKEYRVFMSHVNEFEKMLIESDTYLIKFYFSITKEEQAKRFSEIKESPLKRWKMTPVDEKAQALWDEYTIYKKKMFEKTHTDISPWVIIDANKKSSARIKTISHILETIPYK
ncbi:polyphosphate kinase 2 [Sungkyunkwania multivorans]|uniref:ADP/GDP-polyphosphate phosphotransferase n=1 Tax=Sungkyunkwania multivorans TaxID=1173618 RepID=A0ABW3CXL7_9FLAO